MEPCKGGELLKRIEEVFRYQTKPMYPESFICNVMKQLLRALAFMHGQRLLHKDLKPQNIMMESDDSDSIKVIDFGLAEIFERDQETTREAGGTGLYMAPEAFAEALTMKS